MSSAHPHHAFVRTPSDLLAIVGYLLGYQPEPGQLVLMVVHDNQLSQILALQADIPEDSLGDAAAYVSAHVAPQQAEVILLAYGSQQQVAPLTIAVLAALHTAQVDVAQALRIADGRYFRLLGEHDDPHGEPFDTTTSAVGATAVLAGLVALPNRQALEQLFTPAEGPAAATMRRALRRARTRHPDPHTGRIDDASDPDAPADYLRAGIRAVDVALAVGEYRLDDDTAADLLLYLQHRSIRDHAWLATTVEHQGLWADLTRRAPDELAAPVASLLAHAALLEGNGPVVNIALSVALARDPDYDLARLLLQIVQLGVPPDMLEAALAQAASQLQSPPQH